MIEPPYQRKKNVLIEHEARQLLKIKLELDKKTRVMFVTMDKKSRRFSTGPILGYPGSAIITHKGFVQIIDMLIGFSSDSDLWQDFFGEALLPMKLNNNKLFHQFGTERI